MGVTGRNTSLWGWVAIIELLVSSLGSEAAGRYELPVVSLASSSAGAR